MRIRKARKSKGLSQAGLAKKLGVNRSAVANWECAASMPCSARLERLAIATDVSFEWLATGRGKPSLVEEWVPAVDAQIVDDPDEVRLLLAYRSFSAAEQRALFKFMALRFP